MKLRITCEKPRSSQWFEPKDEVRGRLEIHGAKFRRPPRILVKFRGTLETKLRPQLWGDVQSPSCTGPKHTKVTLFNKSKELSLESPSVSTDCADFDQTYFLPFVFTFPPCYADCLRAPTEGTSFQLPPSLDISAPGLRVKAIYLIIAVVERSGLPFWAATAKQTVPFSPLPPDCVLLKWNVGFLPTSDLAENSRELEVCTTSSGIAPYVTDTLPRYSPSLRLELLLPGPPVLSIGSPVRLRLLFHVPLELLNERDVYVRSATAKLQSTLNARLGSVSRSVVQSRHVWSAGGLVLVDRNEFELEMGSWGECIVPNAQPNFRSCDLDLAYSIEVAAGISLDGSEKVHYVKASLGVIVSNPPPAYEPPAYEMEDGLTRGSRS